MARDVHSSVVKVMDGNSSFTYYLVKLNGGLVHQHLAILGMITYKPRRTATMVAMIRFGMQNIQNLRRR